MAGVFSRISSRCSLLKQTSALITRRSNMTTRRMIAYEEMQQYWAKNRQLARPLSPHLSIYGYHLTMVMSITNRVMAVAIQGVLAGGSCILLAAPIDFKTIVDWVRDLNLSPAVINGFKYLIATPFVFHMLTGIRHFIWDTGLGYKNRAVLQVSYGILLATMMISTALVFGVKPSST